MPRAAVALLILLLAGPASAGHAPRADVETAAAAAAIEAKAYPDEAAVLAALRQAQVSSVADPLRAEARMLQLLQRLRETPAPWPSTRELVERLAQHSPLTWTDPVDPDHGRGLQVPAFAVAGSARAALHRWDRAAAEARYRRALAAGDLETLRSATDHGALAAVVREADGASLALLRAVAPAAPEVRLALFERLADPALARELLQASPDRSGLLLIGRVAALLPADAAFEVLSTPALHSGYTSAARLAIGHLLAAHSPARTHLLATLGDAWGGSSAQALAESADPATRAALAAVLERENDGPHLRRALLALHLMDDAAARSLLAAFAADSRRPGAAREEVRAWLP